MHKNQKKNLRQKGPIAMNLENSECSQAAHISAKKNSYPKVDGSGEHVSGGGHWGVCGSGCPRDPHCPQGWTELDTGCYKLMERTRVTKTEAEQACQKVINNYTFLFL